MWRFDYDDGSWFRIEFNPGGIGRKTTWHAENEYGTDNEFSWTPKGGKVVITETLLFDDLDAAQLTYSVRKKTTPNGGTQLFLRKYELPLVRE